MKFLYITTVGSTMEFFLPVIRELLDRGHQVELACNEADVPLSEECRRWSCNIYPISCSRSPLDKGNLMAIGQIRELVNKERYDIVHCHTPLAAACTRIACRDVRKNGTRVFYTAHGFHFFRGAPLANWLLYYPVEKLCARLTDVLITINREDYELAKNKLPAQKVVYVPGVGIDMEKFGNAVVDPREKRRELAIPENASVLLSVGELSKRKNHEVLLKAAAEIENLYVVIAGEGALHGKLEQQAKQLGIEKRVRLLGYRTDIAQLCAVCDIFALPSLQEGLPVALMEAMASEKTVICSRIRGNTDLMGEENPFLFDPTDVQDCIRVMGLALAADKTATGAENRERVQPFCVSEVVGKMLEIYGICDEP